MAFNVGSAVVFSVQMLNASGVVTAPTTLSFQLREEIDGTELYWDLVPTTPTGQSAIAGSAGNYSVTFVARKPERLTGQWTGAGNSVNQANQQTYFVRHSGIAAIDHP
jgi:hypothetical protein